MVPIPPSDASSALLAGSATPPYNGTDLYFLPALPKAWPTGTVKGLRARGGFEVRELAWQDGKLTHAEIHSALGGDVTLRYGDQVVTRPTKAGETFVFTP